MRPVKPDPTPEPPSTQKPSITEGGRKRGALWIPLNTEPGLKDQIKAAADKAGLSATKWVIKTLKEAL